MFEIDGKTALVTGGAKRLGRAVSLGLAANGAGVVVHYRSSVSEAESLAEEIRRAGVQAWTVQADLGSPRAVEALWDRARDLAGPMDILVNNASIFPESRLNDVTVEQVHLALDVNALAPFLLSRRFAAQGREGVIVNLLDARVVDYDRLHVAYHLSKRALFSLTRMMAVEFAPRIRVNAVAPGLILPPEGKDTSYLEKLAFTNPLNRYGSVEEIAEAVLFLIRSDFVTGQAIYVDGGRHLRGNLYG